MKFDLRVTIGLLFAAYGVILAVFGLLTPDAMYERSLGVNINLIWGLVMLVFGGIMLAFALVSKRKGAN
jgi:multisubunit Na+/H+ antiporter MnhG subunit